MSLIEVPVGGRGQVARLLNIDDEFAARLAALVVGDGQNHGLGAGRAALLGDRQATVLREGCVQSLWCLGVFQIDRVAVWVAPIRQCLILDLGARADLDGGRAQLHGCLVFTVWVDRHLYARGGGVLAVGGLVGERRRSRLLRTHVRDLEGAARASNGHGSPGRLGGRGCGQHVPVKVGVVVEDG